MFNDVYVSIVTGVIIKGSFIILNSHGELSRDNCPKTQPLLCLCNFLTSFPKYFTKIILI